MGVILVFLFVWLSISSKLEARCTIIEECISFIFVWLGNLRIKSISLKLKMITCGIVRLG